MRNEGGIVLLTHDTAIKPAAAEYTYDACAYIRHRETQALIIGLDTRGENLMRRCGLL